MRHIKFKIGDPVVASHLAYEKKIFPDRHLRRDGVVIGLQGRAYLFIRWAGLDAPMMLHHTFVERVRIDKTTSYFSERWQNHEDLLLGKLWNDGLRTGLIADRMKRTKNSIIGRAHRLKLEPRKSPIKRTST